MFKIKEEINLNYLLISLTLLYFPVMMLSNVIGVKINYVIALFAISISIFLMLKRNRSTLLMVSFLVLIFVKILLLGVYGLKPLMITVLGSVLLLGFIESFEKITRKQKYFFVNYIVCFSFFVSAIIILQKVNVLPASLGRMDFLNTVGVNIFGEYDSGYRVSSYFYHPYDTALAIIPLLVSISNLHRFKAFLLYLFFAATVMMLGLKVLVLFTLLYVVFNKFCEKISSRRNMMIMFLVMTFLVFTIPFNNVSNDYIAFSAGRLVIWKIMILEWLEKSYVTTLLFGNNFDILSESLFWASDESYSPHNQFLYNVLYLGGVFYFYFIVFFSKLLSISKQLNSFLLIMFITFGNTGDLVSFLSFWVSASMVYAVLSLKMKNEESDVPKVASIC